MMYAPRSALFLKNSHTQHLRFLYSSYVVQQSIMTQSSSIASCLLNLIPSVIRYVLAFRQNLIMDVPTLTF
jgi:hypothetical protein